MNELKILNMIAKNVKRYSEMIMLIQES